MAKFNAEQIDNGVLEGTIQMAGEEIVVNIDLENDSAKMADFKGLIAEVEKFAAYFTKEKQAEVKQDIAKVVIDGAFEQEDEEPTDEDYQSLQDDLQLADVYAFDGGFVLTYSADESFPESDIVAQLNEDYAIDEIAVYDQEDWDEEEDEDEEDGDGDEE